MEPNENLVRGKFMRNVIFRALPGAFTNIILIIGVMLFYLAFEFPMEEMSTICAILMGVVGMLVLHRVCTPYNKIRKILVVSMCVTFAFMMFFFKNLFTLVNLSYSSILVLVVFSLLAFPLIQTLGKGLESLDKRFATTQTGSKPRAGRHASPAKRK